MYKCTECRKQISLSAVRNTLIGEKGIYCPNCAQAFIGAEYHMWKESIEKTNKFPMKWEIKEV